MLIAKSGKDLEQECLELLVGAVDLVDEQHRRDRVVVVDRVEQRPPQQEVRAEDSCSARTRSSPSPSSRMCSSWRGVVPLVRGVGEVDALVALQADEASAESRRKRAGRLRLADTRLTLEKERLVDPHRDKDRRGETAVAQVVVRAEQVDDRVDRGRLRGIGANVHILRVTGSASDGQAEARACAVGRCGCDLDGVDVDLCRLDDGEHVAAVGEMQLRRRRRRHLRDERDRSAQADAPPVAFGVDAADPALQDVARAPIRRRSVERDGSWVNRRHGRAADVARDSQRSIRHRA